MRLWDVREKHSSTRMFKIPNTGGDIGFCSSKEDLVTVSSGNTLYGFDTRYTTSVIVTEPHLTFSVPGEDNEINDYGFGYSNGLIAVPADSGAIQLIHQSDFSPSGPPMPMAHSNIASTARFLPNDKNLITGGYDCNACTWKVDSGELRPDKHISISSLLPAEDPESSKTQTINPPFVTSLNIFSNDVLSRSVIGSGDGSVIVVDSKRGKPDFRQLAWGGAQVHASACTATAWSPDGESVWSVGNDRTLINMNENRITVRMPLPGKGGCVSVLTSDRIAVGCGEPEIRIYQFS
jgi:WD40 repeat protein